MAHDRHIASELEPGQFVILPGEPDWGIGQIQSVAGDRVTVNFENAGKRLINLKNAELKLVERGTQ
jgi:FKBP-type peptidyl-prolyl cis-trans isomerase 2